MKGPVNGTTITVSGFGVELPLPSRPKAKMVKPDLGMDGLMATIKALKALGFDLERLPMAVARMIYFSGVAFAGSDSSSEEERQKWRDSVIWPSVKDGGEKFDVHVYLGKARNLKGEKP